MLRHYNISVIYQCNTELFQQLIISMLTRNTRWLNPYYMMLDFISCFWMHVHVLFNFDNVNKFTLTHPLSLSDLLLWLLYLPGWSLHVQVQRCRNSSLVHHDNDAVDIPETLFVMEEGVQFDLSLCPPLPGLYLSFLCIFHPIPARIAVWLLRTSKRSNRGDRLRQATLTECT